MAASNLLSNWNIGLAAAGTIGTVTGAAAVMDIAKSNADQQYDTLGDSALIGAAASGGAIVGGGALGYIGYRAAASPKVRNIAKAAGKATLEGIGNTAIFTGKQVAKTAAESTVTMGDAISKAFLKVDNTKPNMIGNVRLNKAGKVAATLLALGTMANDARKTYDDSRAGTPTGMVTSTPNIDYAGPEQYGAGGDLVFALNQNRRG